MLEAALCMRVQLPPVLPACCLEVHREHPMTQSDERGYGTAWTRASGVRDAALPSCSNLLQLLRLVHARLSGFKTKCIGVGVVIGGETPPPDDPVPSLCGNSEPTLVRSIKFCGARQPHLGGGEHAA